MQYLSFLHIFMAFFLLILSFGSFIPFSKNILTKFFTVISVFSVFEIVTGSLLSVIGGQTVSAYCQRMFVYLLCIVVTQTLLYYRINDFKIQKMYVLTMGANVFSVFLTILSLTR